MSFLFKSQRAAQSPTESTQSDQETSLYPSIASNLIVLVSNQEMLPQQLALENPKSLILTDSFKPLVLKPSFKNLQFAATVSSGSAVLKNWSGTAVATQEFYPDIILGHSTRLIGGLSKTLTNNSDKYLEIGVEYGECFNETHFLNKVGVDPDPKFIAKNGQILFKLTSDEYFKMHLIDDTLSNDCIEKLFHDVIFIDGMHQAEYFLRDINNSIQLISEKGRTTKNSSDCPINSRKIP